MTPSHCKLVLLGAVLCLFGVPGQTAQPLFEDWRVRWNQSVGSIDRVRATTVDPVGNLYVAGESSSASSGRDYLILKISPAGQVLWVNSYNGPANGDDSPAAIAVDAFGEVFVTGSSEGIGSDLDIATVRLTSDGFRSPSWRDIGHGLGVRRYNGLGNGSDGGLALALDVNGFSYVTGRSLGAGTFTDVVTIKYPQISNQAGDEAWVRRYNGAGNGIDEPVAVLADAAGLVHVLAASEGIGTDTDWAFLRYDANGNLASSWPTLGESTGVRRFSSLGAVVDRPVAMVRDAAGNLIATGVSRPGATGDDLTVLKLLADGQFAWTNYYNGPGNGADVPAAIRVDVAGDVIVGGTSTGFSSGDDFVLLRLTGGGTFSAQWPSTGVGVGIRRLDGGHFTGDFARALTIDSVGDVLITGESFSFTSGNDFLTVKVSASGQVLWSHRFDAGGNGAESPRGLFVDLNDNLFLVGDAQSLTGSDDDILALRFGVTPASSLTSPTLYTYGLGRSLLLSPPYSGSQPLHLQWRLNGSDLPGRNGSSLSLNPAGVVDAGAYSLMVSNRAGVVTLNVAELAILQLGVNSSQATLQLNGAPGRSYRLDHAPEVSATPGWQTLGNVVGTSSAVFQTDPTATSGQPRRFYRAVPLP